MKYDLVSQLMPLAEPDYRDFHVRLVPELAADGMLGVRMPALRALGRELARSPDVHRILDDRTPDRYYEETVVRGAVIGAAKLSTAERLRYCAEFVPYITNWAICDTFVSGLKFKEADLPAVREFLTPYLSSTAEFPARFGAVMLLRFFVRADCLADTLGRLCALPAEGYNARMAAAWALAECLVRFPEQTLDFVDTHPLPAWTYRKMLQKALESRRLPDDLRPVLKERRKSL
ncbi:MAG: DNA alkylation repair protein [Butyricicoccus sp.]